MENRKFIPTVYFLLLFPVLTISGLTDTNLIIAKDNGLSSIDLQTQNSVPLIRQGVPYSIDYNQEADKNFRLYWSDSEDRTIYSGILHDEGLIDVSPVIKSKNGALEGIAVDRLTKHLYWINSGLGLIEASTLDGSFQSPVVTGLIKPRALAVDSSAGLLFWSDWNDRNPHIGRSTLSGSNNTIIVSVDPAEGGWINAITLVPSSQKIYWIDAKSHSIYESTYDGQFRRQIFHSGHLLLQPMGLQIVHNKIYWSNEDEDSSKVYQFSVDSDEPPKVIFQTFSKLFGIASLKHETNTQNPCSNNAGCSHLCLLNGKLPACHCPYSTSIGPDNKTCQQATKAVAVFYQPHGKKPVLYIQKLLNPSWPLKPSIVVKSLQTVALDYDAVHNRIFWLDDEDRLFLQNSLGHKKQLPMFTEGAKTFAVDGKTENIYLGISSPLPQISQCSIETSVCIPLIIEDIGIPDTLIIHNERRELFWLNKFSTVVKIESFALDNTKQRKTITSGKDLCCMTIDLQNDKVFWVDNTMNRIFWKSLDDHKSWYWPIPVNMSVVSLSTADNLLFVASNKKIITLNMTDKSWKASKVTKKDGTILAVKSIFYPKDLISSSHTQVKTSTEHSTEIYSTSTEDGNDNTTQTTDYSSCDYSTENLLADDEQNSTCSRNCSNNGSCVRTASGEEMCNCLPPFWGENCEHLSCNCRYGKCIMQDNKIRCICSEGIRGYLCKKNKCEEHCYNGNCTLIAGEPSCVCYSGWFGPRCDQPIVNEIPDKKVTSSVGDREFMIIEQNHLKVFGMKISSVIIEIVIAIQFVILILMSYCLISRHCRRESEYMAEEALYNQPLNKQEDFDSNECKCGNYKKPGVADYMKKLKEWLNNINSPETTNTLPSGNPDSVELLHKEKSPPSETIV